MANGTAYNASYDFRSLILNEQRGFYDVAQFTAREGWLYLLFFVYFSYIFCSSPGMWDTLLKQSKAAGIDIVQTYVFW